MGLKNLKSQFDLVPGPTAPVENMESMQGPQFDNGPSSTLHVDSLPQIPTTSPFQDIDGLPGPQSQLPTDEASQTHIDSLQSVPGGDSNSPFQDLDGLPDPLYNTLNGTSDSPFNSRNGTGDHMIDLLTGLSTSTNSGRTYKPDGNPGMHDLNGNEGPSFNMGADSTLKQDLLANIYQSAMNPGASYGAGQPGATWPSVNPGSIDLDGIAPEGYANPDTGDTYG